MHPLILYWQGLFPSDYVEERSLVRFQVPEFQDPILSANFLLEQNFKNQDQDQEKLPYFTYIYDAVSEMNRSSFEGYQKRMQFFLGVRDPRIASSKKHASTDLTLQTLPLIEVHEEDWFQFLLREGFPQDYEFLKRLIPHIANSGGSHRSIVCSDDKGKPIGMLQLGMVKGIALANNVAVATKHRRRGVAQTLIQAAIEQAKQNDVYRILFWTEHDFLEQYADENYQMEIYFAN